MAVDWKPGMKATNGARFASFEITDGERTGAMFWTRPGNEGAGTFHCWPEHIKDFKPDRRDSVTRDHLDIAHWRAHVRAVDALCDERGIPARRPDGSRILTEDRVRLLVARGAS